jgi:predicted dehydrogenase
MKNGIYGFGIIGCGVIAPTHVKGIAACPEAELVACCDIDEEKGRKFAADNGDLTFYTDYEQMVADPNVDVVCVCTPSGLHAECVIAAAKAGKNVFCEKPLDIDRDKMTAMIAACREANVKLGCVFQSRTYPDSIKIREAIAAGTLGKMTLGDAFLKDYRSRAYYKSAGWRGTWALDGGGALMNQGVHGVDLLLWLMNALPVSSSRAAPSAPSSAPPPAIPARPVASSCTATSAPSSRPATRSRAGLWRTSPTAARRTLRPLARRRRKTSRATTRRSPPRDTSS